MDFKLMERRNELLTKKKSFGIDRISILWSGAGPRTFERMLVDGWCKQWAREARVGGIDLC